MAAQSGSGGNVHPRLLMVRQPRGDPTNLMNRGVLVLLSRGGYKFAWRIGTSMKAPSSLINQLSLDTQSRNVDVNVLVSHLSGKANKHDTNSILSDLESTTPNTKILFITPEKLESFDYMYKLLESLYARGKLSLIVIDEAHTVSQWGHSFRPNYLKLSGLKERFPTVPTLALTATATPKLKEDVISILRMKDCKVFKSSFNRPNLKYSVIDKGGNKNALNLLKGIVSEEEFESKHGIVYCHSQAECLEVSKFLSSNAINAQPYHAGLSESTNLNNLQSWIDGTIKVLCATVALGMGIDKNDVRFVIHYSIPKSIEELYQESGRAGRDGELAKCFIFYSHHDVLRARKLIELSKMNIPAKEAAINRLLNVVSYCENKSECMRRIQLEYLGEEFIAPDFCFDMPAASCDVCTSFANVQCMDKSAEAKIIVKFIQETCGYSNDNTINITMNLLRDALKGSRAKVLKDSGLDKSKIYGILKEMSKENIFRFLTQLIVAKFLKEEMVLTDPSRTFAYLRAGVNSTNMITNSVPFPFHQVLNEKIVKCKGVLSMSRYKELRYKALLALVEIPELNAGKNGSKFDLKELKMIASKLPRCLNELTAILSPNTKLDKICQDKIISICIAQLNSPFTPPPPRIEPKPVCDEVIKDQTKKPTLTQKFLKRSDASAKPKKSKSKRPWFMSSSKKKDNLQPTLFQYFGKPKKHLTQSKLYKKKSTTKNNVTSEKDVESPSIPSQEMRDIMMAFIKDDEESEASASSSKDGMQSSGTQDSTLVTLSQEYKELAMDCLVDDLESGEFIPD